MLEIIFPSQETANEDGVLAIGGELTLPYLLAAYKVGIFPWPVNEEYPRVWFSPKERGILEVKKFHLGRTFYKNTKKENFHCTFNRHFSTVIRECAHNKNRTTPTWITEELILGYEELHRAGHAYSVEVYDDDEIVGGLYGVHLQGYVTGESMFYKKSEASKFALKFLIDHLISKQVEWIDVQMCTPILQAVGAKYVTREEFLKLHQLSLSMNTTLWSSL